MAAPSYTYSLTNGSTADASQVMQDFNDILNGVTDGTKDLTISTLTANGAASLKGSVTLGLSTSNDLTVTGSLASSIPIKTTNVFDIGSATLGLAGAYFGTGSTQTARIVSTASLVGSRTYTMLDAGASANFVLSEGTATINGTKTFAGQLIGKGTATNDAASAGYIGETMTISRVYSSKTTLSSGTAVNIGTTTSITLTPGDWEIHAWGGFETGASTTVSELDIAVSATSATLPAGDAFFCPNSSGEAWATATYNAFVFGGGQNGLALVPYRVVIASGQTQTLYLVGKSIFGVSTMKVWGFMEARRMR